MHCFREKGYAATTIGDISERAGHTKGAFYFHFNTKEELFFHILKFRSQLRRGWTEIPRNYISSTTTLEEVILMTLLELERMLQDERKWFMVMTDFYIQTQRDPESRNRLREHYGAWVTEIATFVDVLKDGGWIAYDKDSRRIAEQIWAFSEGYSATTILFGEFDMDTLLHGLVKLVD